MLYIQKYEIGVQAGLGSHWEKLNVKTRVFLGTEAEFSTEGDASVVGFYCY